MPLEKRPARQQWRHTNTGKISVWIGTDGIEKAEQLQELLNYRSVSSLLKALIEQEYKEQFGGEHDKGQADASGEGGSSRS